MSRQPNEVESSMFPIFVLSLLTLFLVPYTIYRLVYADAPPSAAKASPGAPRSLAARARALLTPANGVVLLLWVAWGLLYLWIVYATKESAPFEPYDILGLQIGATEREIKKAYRGLSLKYHPDKNPDPAAAGYFAEKITKAYKTLTDSAARANYEKYGHPDGPQGFSVGVALPAFVFGQGKAAPLVLLALVLVGIIGPLAAAVVYLTASSQYTPANVMHQTVGTFHFFLKPAMALSRLPEVLAHATEFLTIPERAADTAAVKELQALLRGEATAALGDSQEKLAKKRRPAVLKAYLLLLAQASRLPKQSLPPGLRPDAAAVVAAAPLLLEQLVQLAASPHPPDHCGWLRSTLSALELTQSLVQAVPLSLRKGGAGESLAALQQLPHVGESEIKGLARRRIRGLPEFLATPAAERRVALMEGAGMGAAQVLDVERSLALVPAIHMDAVVRTEGHEETREEDVLTVTVKLRVVRGPADAPSLAAAAKARGVGEGGAALMAAAPEAVKAAGLAAAAVAAAARSGKDMPAHAPCFPAPKTESWWVIVADPEKNRVLGSARAHPIEGPLSAGPVDGTGAPIVAVAPEDDEETPGVCQVKFMVLPMSLPAGLHTLTVLAVCDSWVGAEKRVAVKLRVDKKLKPEAAAAAPAAVEPPEIDAEADDDDDGPAENDESDESEYSEDEVVEIKAPDKADKAITAAAAT